MADQELVATSDDIKKLVVRLSELHWHSVVAVRSFKSRNTPDAGLQSFRSSFATLRKLCFTFNVSYPALSSPSLSETYTLHTDYNVFHSLIQVQSNLCLTKHSAHIALNVKSCDMSRHNNDVQFEVPRLRKMSLVTNTRGIEYVESSHRSILAREAQKATTTQARSRQTSKASSTQATGYRRPHTPVPSLEGPDSLSPISAMTRSPITPTFDDFGTYLQSPPLNSDLRQAVDSSDIDRPQDSRMRSSMKEPPKGVPSNRTSNHARNASQVQAPEEVSFIDWDDDSTKLQRMKQSFNFNRPNRPKKLDTSLLKSPDWHVNAVPRFSSQKNAGFEPPPAQARPVQTQLASANFSRPHISLESSRMPPPSRPDRRQSNGHHGHAAPSSSGDRYTNDVQALPCAAGSEQMHHNHIHREDYSLTPVSSYAEKRSPQYRTWDDYDYDMPQHEEEHTALSPQVTNESTGTKSKRIRAIMQGVVKRVSMRDMRKEFERK